MKSFDRMISAIGAFCQCIERGVEAEHLHQNLVQQSHFRGADRP